MDKLEHVSLSVTKVKFDSNFQSDKFIKLRLEFAHDGINPNGSRFTINDLTTYKDSLFLSPLLGNIVQDEDGNYAFGEHDMEFRPNPFKDNQVQLYYLESILGIIPPENLADFSVETKDGRNYVSVTGFLYKNYSNFAEDIINQYEQVPISMEIDVNKYSFDVKDKVYDITDFNYTGITFLNQESGTGMIGANAKRIFNQDGLNTQMLTMLQELKTTIKQFAEVCDKNTNEGGKAMDNIENTIEVYDNADSAISTTTDTVSTENVNDNIPEVVDDNVKEITESFEVSTITEVNVDTPVASDKVTDTTVKFVKTFEVSHEDIRYGLYTLLTSVEEADGEWYYIDGVYDTYFDYSNNSYTKHYRQNYTKNGNDVTFVGERIDIYIEVLTATEKATLDTIRNNYSTEHEELEQLRKFKSDYDENVLDEQRLEVLNTWSTKIKEDVPEFTVLKEKENYSKYSVAELEVQCKCIFADVNANIPAISTTFSAKKDKTFTPVEVKIAEEANLENEPYGGIFREFAEN